ncbi:PD40 domain-containing protein [Leptolyngbya sp. 7M]|uniref:PD40 domain-containing protein n=1 Tax=Leptolyngbya sp. 7M TaxID=2812896 RepID=UPI001B8BD1B4|nr:PD40 domain-containing protein [Leptolyngbya sp. 7M]QYO67752.1 PD40 domain-containing protein [Leptolyngbya sp. 7M]
MRSNSLGATAPKVSRNFGCVIPVPKYVQRFAWYYFASAEAPPISFADLSLTKLSRSNNVAFAAISPDGRSVAYVTYEENGDRALWLWRVSDANSLQIVPPQQLEYWDCPTFSSDGEFVYFITAYHSATHGTMYRVPTLGGQPRKVVKGLTI